MKAGRVWAVESRSTSVSPIVGSEVRSRGTEADEEEEEEEGEGEETGFSEEDIREFGERFTPVEKVKLEKEGEFIRKLVDPSLPSAEERESRNMSGHVSFRNWCDVCVRTMGRDMAHRTATEKDRKVPEYVMDYCFPGDELGCRWTVLGGKGT